MAAIKRYFKKMYSISAEKRFWLCVLGEVEELQIWLIRTRDNIEHKDPKILIVSGFHGEEKAGPYSILKWLKNCDTNIFKRVDLSFIPIVNPVGFKKNQRYSIPGERNNQGFCHPESGEKRSREGEILFNNIDILLPLARDGFLSLHEDNLVKEYYIYTFEKKEGPFTRGLKDALGKYFSKPLDGLTTTGLTPEKMATYVGETGTMVVNGWVNHCKLHDGSLEDFLFHVNVPRIAVTETPGMYQLRRRINAGVHVIDKFIELNLQLFKKQEKNEKKEEV
jgi:hypothetical protein